METKKISKWDAAPESFSNMHSIINKVCDNLIDYDIDHSCKKILINALSEVLDDYNKLEAKHQLDCGLISDYAEENARLKQKNEKASNNIRDLRRVLEENDIATYLNPVTVSWGVANVALQKKTEHFNTQLDNLREKLKEMEKSRNNWRAYYVDMSDICSRDEDDSEMLQAILRKDGYTIEYEGDIDDETIRCQDPLNICKETTQDEVMYQYGRWTLTRPLRFSEAKANADAAILRNQCNRHIDLLDKLRCALEDKGIYCEWNEAALEWRLYGKNKLFDELKQHYEEELRIRCEEIDDKNKLIEKLTNENRVFQLKNLVNGTYGLTGQIALLNREIDDLRMENKNLKYLKALLEKDEEFGRNVGKRVADSIQEGCDKGVYELHPCTRIDIHVEETNNMPTTFDRHAIPRIAVMFNNTQTEMERDTAQHECEELNKKMDTVWRANDELNRKIKELKKENVDLKRTLSRCGRAANTAKRLCNNITSDVERAGIRTPWYDNISCNSCCLRKQGDDI